jgi:hypothetical protein
MLLQFSIDIKGNPPICRGYIPLKNSTYYKPVTHKIFNQRHAKYDKTCVGIYWHVCVPG